MGNFNTVSFSFSFAMASELPSFPGAAAPVTIDAEDIIDIQSMFDNFSESASDPGPPPTRSSDTDLRFASKALAHKFTEGGRDYYRNGRMAFREAYERVTGCSESNAKADGTTEPRFAAYNCSPDVYLRVLAHIKHKYSHNNEEYRRVMAWVKMIRKNCHQRVGGRQFHKRKRDDMHMAKVRIAALEAEVAECKHVITSLRVQLLQAAAKPTQGVQGYSA